MDELFIRGIKYIAYISTVKYKTYLLIYSMIEYTKGLPSKCAKNWEKHIFYLYFFNMDILLIMKITGMKQIDIHVAEINWERGVSQNVDVGLSCCFILCRRSNFKRKYKNHKRYPIFALK